MTMALEAKKLRELDMTELELRAEELQKEMFDLRQRLTTKEEPKTSLLGEKKRDYARLLTVIREKRG
jgi:large subunit ribosomal protein L29